ncbi:globin domain-containing protein [Luteipulveratus halotolerans]|uniref:Oxidoreductase n=1 Tax=Luteipulveratus halotolerans TaxID=1631356 RepID=A0A0L6CFW2_9MICO|nr:oxidoreductase [Luteipulveratus halotolerans]KNX36687.1 oxidoreductase [Luteipulveratus halotolerans]
MGATIHEALGGDAVVLRLAQAWHRRCLADPVVNHAFSHGFHPQHDERLAAYWIEALGGPATYTASLGDQSMVTRMHSGNGVHDEMDRRALTCFEGALDDVGVVDAPLRRTLVAWFAWAIDRMSDYHESAYDVPDGLPMQRWSWDGPVASDVS